MSPVDSRRILITDLSSQLGGRLAQVLEREPWVEAIVGIDTEDPRHELQRTEFVRIGVESRPLQRILRAASIDTVLDTRLIADPLQAQLERIHTVNVRETTELLGACAEAGSPVRRVVFKSSAGYYGWEAGDPAFLTEALQRSRPARTALERAVVAAEAVVREFAALNRDVDVSVLRFTDEIGGEGRTSLGALLSLPVLPAVLGFDPRFQLIHSDDTVGALAHAARAPLRGAYNVAADGVLVLSELASLLGKPWVPLLPPWGAGLAATQLRRLGLRVPVEMVRQLRYGRGLDNRRLKATGFSYRYTTREALLRLRADQKLRPMLESGDRPYRYQPDVEEFLRWSPSVRTAPRMRDPLGSGPGEALSGYDALGIGELLELIPSLGADALALLRGYENEHQQRRTVLEALETAIARASS